MKISLDDFGRRLLKIYCDVSPMKINLFINFFFARRPIGSCNLVLFVHHRLMRGEKSVHDSRIGAKPFVHCET